MLANINFLNKLYNMPRDKYPSAPREGGRAKRGNTTAGGGKDLKTSPDSKKRRLEELSREEFDLIAREARTAFKMALLKSNKLSYEGLERAKPTKSKSEGPKDETHEEKMQKIARKATRRVMRKHGVSASGAMMATLLAVVVAATFATATAVDAPTSSAVALRGSGNAVSKGAGLGINLGFSPPPPVPYGTMDRSKGWSKRADEARRLAATHVSGSGYAALVPDGIGGFVRGAAQAVVRGGERLTDLATVAGEYLFNTTSGEMKSVAGETVAVVDDYKPDNSVIGIRPVGMGLSPSGVTYNPPRAVFSDLGFISHPAPLVTALGDFSIVGTDGFSNGYNIYFVKCSGGGFETGRNQLLAGVAGAAYDTRFPPKLAVNRDGSQIVFAEARVGLTKPVQFFANLFNAQGDLVEKDILLGEISPGVSRVASKLYKSDAGDLYIVSNPSRPSAAKYIKVSPDLKIISPITNGTQPADLTEVTMSNYAQVTLPTAERIASTRSSGVVTVQIEQPNLVDLTVDPYPNIIVEAGDVATNATAPYSAVILNGAGASLNLLPNPLSTTVLSVKSNASNTVDFSAIVTNETDFTLFEVDHRVMPAGNDAISHRSFIEASVMNITSNPANNYVAMKFSNGQVVLLPQFNSMLQPELKQFLSSCNFKKLSASATVSASGSITSSETISKTASESASESAAASASASKSLSDSASGALTLTPSMSRSLSASFSATATSSFTTLLSSAISESSNPSASCTASATFSAAATSVAESLSPSTSASPSPSPSAGPTLSPSVSLSRSASASLSLAQSLSPTVTKAVLESVTKNATTGADGEPIYKTPEFIGGMSATGLVALIAALVVIYLQCCRARGLPVHAQAQVGAAAQGGVAQQGDDGDGGADRNDIRVAAVLNAMPQAADPADEEEAAQGGVVQQGDDGDGGAMPAATTPRSRRDSLGAEDVRVAEVTPPNLAAQVAAKSSVAQFDFSTLPTSGRGGVALSPLLHNREGDPLLTERLPDSSEGPRRGAPNFTDKPKRAPRGRGAGAESTGGGFKLKPRDPALEEGARLLNLEGGVGSWVSPDGKPAPSGTPAQAGAERQQATETGKGRK